MFLGGPTPACGACGGTVFVFSSVSSWHVLLGEVRRPGSTAGVRVIFIPGWGFSGGPSGFLIQRLVAGLPGVTGVAGPRSGGGCSWYAENVFANTTQESHTPEAGQHGWSKGHFYSWVGFLRRAFWFSHSAPRRRPPWSYWSSGTPVRRWMLLVC